jgi:hypothetical protein
MARSLTEKQQKTAELVGAGKNQLDAIQEVYHSTRKCAYQISHNLKRNEVFQSEVNKIRNIKEGIIRDEGVKISQLIDQMFPKRERAEILIRLAKNSKKDSVVLEALQEINKLGNEYPQEKIPKGEIGEIKFIMINPSQREEDREKGEIIEGKELPAIEEARVREDSGQEESLPIVETEEPPQGGSEEETNPEQKNEN